MGFWKVKHVFKHVSAKGNHQLFWNKVFLIKRTTTERRKKQTNLRTANITENLMQKLYTESIILKQMKLNMAELGHITYCMIIPQLVMIIKYHSVWRICFFLTLIQIYFAFLS